MIEPYIGKQTKKESNHIDFSIYVHGCVFLIGKEKQLLSVNFDQIQQCRAVNE